MENKCYKIYCATGCSCCSYENHYRGLYKTKEEAESRINRFKSGKDYPLASQYSKYGNYTIMEYEFESISNNRIIVADSVYSESFIKVNLETGELINVEDDYLEDR